MHKDPVGKVAAKVSINWAFNCARDIAVKLDDLAEDTMWYVYKALGTWTGNIDNSQ